MRGHRTASAVDDRRRRHHVVPERAPRVRVLGLDRAVESAGAQIDQGAALARNGTVVADFPARRRPGRWRGGGDPPAGAAGDPGGRRRLGTGAHRDPGTGAPRRAQQRRGRVHRRPSGAYDLVVGADGIRSSVRELAFGPIAPRYVGQMYSRRPSRRTSSRVRRWPSTSSGSFRAPPPRRRNHLRSRSRRTSPNRSTSRWPGVPPTPRSLRRLRRTGACRARHARRRTRRCTSARPRRSIATSGGRGASCSSATPRTRAPHARPGREPRNRGRGRAGRAPRRRGERRPRPRHVRRPPPRPGPGGYATGPTSRSTYSTRERPTSTSRPGCADLRPPRRTDLNGPHKSPYSRSVAARVVPGCRATAAVDQRCNLSRLDADSGSVARVGVSEPACRRPTRRQ